MDRQTVLRAFNDQIRRGATDPDARIERDDHVVRFRSANGGWNGILWSDLDSGNAGKVIAEQIQQFADAPGPWEWKHNSHT